MGLALIIGSALLPLLEVVSLRIDVTTNTMALVSILSLFLLISLNLSIRQSSTQETLRTFVENQALSEVSGPALSFGQAPPNTFLVIVPAFNEAENLGTVLTELSSHKFDILVIDDGSSDSTREIAASYDVQVVSHKVNLGVGAALRTGFRYAIAHNYNCVIQVDADGQHIATEIIQLINASCITQSDMIIGSRFLSDNKYQITGPRKSAIKVLSKMASFACKVPITDSTSGFRLIRGELLTVYSESFSSNYLGDTFEAVIMAGRGGFSISETGVLMRQRISGVSTANTFQALINTVRAALVFVFWIHPRIKKISSSHW